MAMAKVKQEDGVLRIVELRAENVKRLSAVEIRPDPDDALVIVSGKNAAGKTSVLDAIAYALGGKRLAGPAPVRKGQDEASVRVDLGEYVVTRTWTKGGAESYLRVESGEAQFRSPQALLDRLTGDLTFDPLAFSRMDPKAQVATLAQAAGIKVELDGIVAKRVELYGDRTLVGREAKQAEAARDAIPLDPEAPANEIPLAAIIAERADLTRQAQTHVKAEGLATSLRARRRDLSARVAQARAAAAALEQEERQAAEQEEAALLHMETLPVVDLISVDARLQGLLDGNRRWQQQAQRRAHSQAASEAFGRFEALTCSIVGLDEEAARLVRRAGLPVPGLALTEEGVAVNGIPLASCSASEQLKVSLAVAMALNPTLRIIRIADGSLLDADSLRIVEQMAGERGYQVWIERVAEAADGMAVFIEAGTVGDAGRHAQRGAAR